jgi:hypothetical protein
MIPTGMPTGVHTRHLEHPRFIEISSDHLTGARPANPRLSAAFYETWRDFDRMLIMRADTLILRDDLAQWCKSSYDYIAPPWPAGNAFNLDVPLFGGAAAKKMTVYVGDGCISLRRIRPFISLLNRFQDRIGDLEKRGMDEGQIISLLGALMPEFHIPNLVTASLFATAQRPSHYFKITRGSLPMAAGAWQTNEPEFWQRHVPFISDWKGAAS